MTTTSKKFPYHAESTDGGHYRPFTNLKNIRTTSTSEYASTDLIHSKKAPLNRPGVVTASNFKIGLQTGSKVNKITVHYAHAKVAYQKKVCNIPAPTITLMNGSKAIKNKDGKNVEKKGKAPTTDIYKGSVTFNANFDYTTVNASDFGVRINYPTNTNEDSGYMRLYYLYIVVDYRKPSFNLKMSSTTVELENAPSLSANKCYNENECTVFFNIYNLNDIDLGPTVTITVPAGFTLKGYNDGGDGTVTKVDTYTYRWKIKSLHKAWWLNLAMAFEVDVTFLPGQQNYPATFAMSENLTGKVKNLTVTVLPRPANVDVLPSEPSDPNINNENASKESIDIIRVKSGQPLDFDLEFPEGVTSATLYSCDVGYGDFENYEYTRPEHRTLIDYWDGEYWITTSGIVGIDLNTRPLSKCRIGNEETPYVGAVTLVIVKNDEVLFEIYLDVVPPDPVPSLPYSILTLSQEEMNRLGDENYVVQSYLKETTDYLYARDWETNTRIGVFNNAIDDNITVIETEDPETGEIIETVVDSTDYENLTSEEIIRNADYWGSPISTTNEYNNVECKFHYNKQYPLYIIIGGSSPRNNIAIDTTSYTEPCIIEEAYYDNWESNGTYPVPIDDTVKTDGSFSQINIASLSSATPVIYYDFPFDEDYGTDEQYAIRGIEVTGTVEQNTDDITIYAKLKSPTGESRVRSINLDAKLTDTNDFTIGGMGDLWGFSTTEMTELADWEIEFMVDNSVNNATGTLNYSNVALTVYVAERNEQNVQCYVDGEDISYYGAFIRDVDVPEGLNTDTNYLTIDGTDTNDPYRQNIREKEITIELDIGDSCSLADNTLSLRDLTRLFVNKRDQYNRPIPKRIEFSHYPDIYWEYIMEDTFDNPVDINSYGNVKIKLTVPAGTAYKKTETVTNRAGYVNGLASVNPIITIKPSDELITITETLSDQVFSMGTPTDASDKVIVIDCEDRIVWLKDDEDDDDGENITAQVDFNSDWFSLIDEYSFEADGCALIDISYIERW